MSTSPGQIFINSTPCLAYCMLNLAVAMFWAALLIAYAGLIATSHLMANSVAASPLEMEMTFLTVPLRINGVKVLNRWMFPMQFVLKLSRRVFSNSEGFSSLSFVIFCFFHIVVNLYYGTYMTPIGSSSCTTRPALPMR